MLSVFRDAAKDFSEDDCPMMASSLSYYTVFSLPPLLLIIVTVAGFVFEAATVQQQVIGQAEQMIGPAAAAQIDTMLEKASEDAAGGGWAMILSIGALVFAATGVFVQLQAALNRVWEVMPDPEQGGVLNFFTKRLLSFGMILGIAFLLLVSLAVTAAAAAMTDRLGNLLPGNASEIVVQVVNFLVSFVVITLLFAAIFKWMPDAEIQWRDVWLGAATTSLFFEIGKLLIGLYLGNSNTSDTYGAAGALAIIMLWVCYASMILLFGAELTQAWAARSGRRIEPDEDAVRVIEQERQVRSAERHS